MKLRTGDKVKVTTGDNRGKEGLVSKVLGDKVIIEGINMVKKHLKPKSNNGTGSIVEIEAPIHRSNVCVISSKDKKKEKKTK